MTPSPKAILPLRPAADPDGAEYINVEPEVEFGAWPDLTVQGTHDNANAQRFLTMCGPNMHFASDLRRWLLWSGRHWVIYTQGAIWYWASQVMREFYLQAGDSGSRYLVRFAINSRNTPRLRQMLAQVERTPTVAIESSAFDRRPGLVNCLNGTFD